MAPLRLEQPPKRSDGGPLWRKLAWFVGIWAASVCALGIVAFGIRVLIR
ncbi:MAG: DUF2474 domain-containing protein [Beijerinckiaceae bacterium]|nr:DUF2474 domain-containing protein [Beijerinckiaceae bacterium]